MTRATQKRADAAGAILDQPVLREARDAVREAIVKRIETGDSKPEDDHELCNLLRSGALYWRMLEGYLNSGNVEEFNERQRSKVA